MSEEETLETTEPVEQPEPKTAAEINEIENESTLEEIVDIAAGKLALYMTDFAVMAKKKANVDHFRIPVDVLKGYAADVEPKAEMLDAVGLITTLTRTKMADLGYAVGFIIEPDKEYVSFGWGEE